ncbi:MAG: tetratricopeptide repeat protein, partial [Microscillaceae bacterium]|nr:tetratricopeptide repeat protein [Microscillaceae bacterium]
CPWPRAYVQTGQTDQAEAMLRKIIALRRRNKGEKHPDFATALDQLGQFYLRQGQSQKARPLLEEAALIRQETLPASHPAQAISRTHRALLAEAEGKPAEAERWYQESLAILQQSKGEKHPCMGRPSITWPSSTKIKNDPPKPPLGFRKPPG